MPPQTVAPFAAWLSTVQTAGNFRPNCSDLVDIDGLILSIVGVRDKVVKNSRQQSEIRSVTFAQRCGKAVVCLDFTRRVDEIQAFKHLLGTN